MTKISALILAAGYSARMQEFKPLMHLGDKTILEHAVYTFKSAGVSEISVVTGFRGGEIAASLDGTATCIFNADYNEGVISSIKAGVGALGSCDAFFILPVDIPLVNIQTIKLICGSFLPGNIICPVIHGKKGFPVLFSVRFINDILNFDGKFSYFMEIFNKHIIEVNTKDEAILLDCNTPVDYKHLKLYYERFRKSYLT